MFHCAAMEQKTQSFLRTVTPGGLGVLILLTLISPTKSLDQHLKVVSFEKVLTVWIILVLVLGVTYKTFIRPVIMSKCWADVNRNIEEKLLAMASMKFDPHSLPKNNRLLHYFYRILDKDPSLQIKRNLVYENGYYLTTCADIAFFGAVGTVLHGGFYIVTGNYDYLWPLLAWLVGGLFGLIMMKPYKRRHISLGSEQLEYMSEHYKDELREGIEKYLRQLP